MGQIKVEKNAGGIQGLCVIEPTVHGDARGYFMETYNQKDMEDAVRSGQPVKFYKGSLKRITFPERISTGKTGTCRKRFCI